MPGSVIINNLKEKYENQIQIHRTNIKLFLANPQGVADHINYTETVEKELDEIAKAMDMLEALETLG